MTFHGGRVVFPCALVGLLVLGGCGRSPSPSQGEEKIRAVSHNRPPSVLRAEIQPTSPTVGSILGIAMEAFDPDGDKVEGRFQWMVNGEPVEGGDEGLLEGSRLKRGDRVQCLIVPTDGKDDGKPFLTNEVEVRNSLPVIRSADLEWKGTLQHGRVELAVQAEDEDGDDLTITSEWLLNGEAVQRDVFSMPVSGLKKGDRLKALVCASDGELTRVCLSTKEIVVPNRPPEIVSKPPSRWDTKRGFIYRIRVRDQDGDPVRVRIAGDLPEGAEWDSTAMVLKWTPLAGGNKRSNIRLVAEDPDGGWTVQEFSLEARGEPQ